jgi:hypothetical protein
MKVNMENQHPTVGTQSFTKFCPSCKLANDANAVTCIYCAKPLDLVQSKAAKTDAQTSSEYSTPANGLALYFAGSTTQIGVSTESEFVLGRKTEGDTEVIVDLTKPDGYAMGVSRRHAMVRATDRGYVIIDLNSSNGTWVDGKILVPTQPHELPSGGTIQLGRLKLVAIYNAPAKSK